MKRVLTLLLSFAMLFSVMGICAEELTIDKMSEGKTKPATGKVGMAAGEYLLFEDVDLTGKKSVSIYGKANWSSHWNGEIFEVRIDSVKGEIIGYIDMDSEEEETFGCNINKEGVHDLYIIATYGSAGASWVSKVMLSDAALPEKEAYVPVSDDVIVDDWSDTWAGTSGLSRAVADYAEVGGVKEGKEVGLFYWIWNVNQEDTVAVINNTTYQKEYPDAYKEDGYLHPAWPLGKTNYFWAEPLYGYYTGVDYWVYRKDAELLSEAGVDFLYFDDSNGKGIFRRNMGVFLEAFSDAKRSGVDVPKFTILSSLSYPVIDTKYMVEYLYLTFYKKGLYEDLWYYHEGKPLIMASEEALTHFLDKDDPEDVKLYNEIMNFFTFRGSEGDWSHTKDRKPTKWTFTDRYPQITFGVDSAGNPETVSVSAARNASIVDASLTPMSLPHLVRGKNYTETHGHIWKSGTSVYNLFFEEQVSGALMTDARIMILSSWNEWTAVRNENYIGKFKNSFVDHFDSPGTRDLGISVDENKDHGFMLMVDAIRKWKGVRPAPTASEKTTIDMANPASWDNVAPTFYNVKGVYERDIDGYADYHYENKTARNNIKTSKAARNDEFIWFSAICESDITAPGGNNWMALYIDSDRNHATGWEGYDYKIVNTDVFSFNGTWNAIGKAEQVLSGKQLQIKVAKALVGIGNVTDIEFKWTDNSDDSDILNFYIIGLTAPTGRFNYVYSEIPQKAVTKEDREALKNTTVVKIGSNKAVIRGGVMDAFEANTAYGVREIDNTAYVPYTMLKDAFGYGTTLLTYERERNFFKIDAKEGMAYTTVGTFEATIDGAKIKIKHPVVDVDGIAYVPVMLMFDLYGFDVRNLGNGIYAFGEEINVDAALRAAELI